MSFEHEKRVKDESQITVWATGRMILSFTEIGNIGAEAYRVRGSKMSSVLDMVRLTYPQLSYWKFLGSQHCSSGLLNETSAA